MRRFVEGADRFALWIVAAILAEMAVVAGLKAFYMPMWLDEIMGTFIAKLPHTSDIWAICKSGADNQPPLYHYVTRSAIKAFGSDPLGMRLPSLTGYIVFCVCLYWFVSRRTSRFYGLIAMLFQVLTRASYYATEGRPYALMLGCAGVAVICWQSINMQRQRTLMLPGLTLALACALNLHYYSVLLFFPFWIAESVRTYVRRKVDKAVWLALTVPISVLLVYVPVIWESKVNSGIPYAFFSTPSLSFCFWNFAGDFFGSTITALICLSILYFLLRSFGGPPPDNFARRDRSWRSEVMPEVFLILGFACIPALAIILSKFGTHIFFTRYAIAGVFGFAVILACCTWFAFGGKRGPALVFTFVLLLLTIRNQKVEDFPIITAGSRTSPEVNVRNRIPQVAQRDVLPIVVTNIDDFMRFSYYADPALRKRIFYVSSEKLAGQYLGFTFLERMMIGSAPYFGTNVVDYASFLREHRKFYLFGPLEPTEWLVPKLMAEHIELQLVQGGPKDAHGTFADVCLLAQMGSV